MPPDIGRRMLLQATGGGILGIGALGLPTSSAAHQAFGQREPVTMAMHLHGSFSEGTASMDAHLQQAQRLGVDVLWWTDHDFRVAALGYRQAVRFDGPSEPENGLAWDWVSRADGGLASARHDFIASPHSPDETGGALRFQATGRYEAEWATYLLEGKAWNSTYSTSYADTVLELDVLPESLSADAEVVVEVESSYRPATGGRPAGQYRLHYRVGARTGRWTEDSGRLGVIGVPAGNGWQRLRMDLRSDHAWLWPDTVAGDASLKSLRVGVRARRGAAVQVVVDRLRFIRGRRSMEDGMALVRRAARAYRTRYPHLTQYAAAEISLVNHLNAFGGDGTLPTYDTTQPIKNTTTTAQRQMIRALHRRGALVSINHPRPGPDLSHSLVTNRGLGADVIEIGTGVQVERLAESFDVAARNAIFMTANGVTDDHAGSDWLDPRRQRWITGVWSTSRGSADLCAAMDSGRAWFYDPLRWSGELDLLVDGHVPMGGALLTSNRRVSVKVTATRMPRNGTLQFVIGRCDRAGTSELVTRNRNVLVPASSVIRGHWSSNVMRGDGVYIRAMVRSADNSVVGFSNPVWVLPASLAAEIPIPRPRRHTD